VGNDKEIDENKVYQFFSKRIEKNNTLKIRALIYNIYHSLNVKLSLIGIIIALILLFIFYIRIVIPLGFGMWISKSDLEPLNTDLESESFFDLYYVKEFLIDFINAIFSIEVLILFVIIAILSIAWNLLNWIQKKSRRTEELFSGWVAGAELTALLQFLTRNGRSKILPSGKRRHVTLMTLRAIEEEMESMHPLKDGDVSNVSFFLYKKNNEMQLIERTDGAYIMNSPIDRKSVIGHYACLCNDYLNVYAVKGLPFKFKSLSDGPSNYNSILAIPVTKKGHADRSIGVITIDSTEPFRFVGMRGDIFNRIRPQITVLIELYAAHREVARAREA
jgi:hypothetical protein